MASGLGVSCTIVRWNWRPKQWRIELDYDALKFYEGVYEKYGEFEGYGPITPQSPLPAELHRRNR